MFHKPSGSEFFLHYTSKAPFSFRLDKETTLADDTIAVYDSQSPEYHRAFEIFLDHTDQKLKARNWLDELIDRLSRRDTFIDAGAGNGKVTAWFTEKFGRTIAIEPNPSLRSELMRECRSAEVIAERVLDVRNAPAGDLILCSHVFYYIDAAEWMETLERLVSWLSSGGVLVLAVQNENTDCMRMLYHFHGRPLLGLVPCASI